MIATRIAPTTRMTKTQKNMGSRYTVVETEVKRRIMTAEAFLADGGRLCITAGSSNGRTPGSDPGSLWFESLSRSLGRPEGRYQGMAG